MALFFPYGIDITPGIPFIITLTVRGGKMNIKELETLTGVTKRNIRFYEKKGLLTPYRNPQNYYREYTDEDVKRLRAIKLFRLLDMSYGGHPFDAGRKSGAGAYDGEAEREALQ